MYDDQRLGHDAFRRAQYHLPQSIFQPHQTAALNALGTLKNNYKFGLPMFVNQPVPSNNQPDYPSDHEPVNAPHLGSQPPQSNPDVYPQKQCNGLEESRPIVRGAHQLDLLALFLS